MNYIFYQGHNIEAHDYGGIDYYVNVSWAVINVCEIKVYCYI